MKNESYIAPERMDRYTTTADDGIIFHTPAESKILRKKAREALTRKRELEVRRRRKEQRKNR